VRNLIWLVPFGIVAFATCAIGGLALAYLGIVVGIPVVLVGSVLGTGCLEKAAGAGFFPWSWKWQFKGKSNGQTNQNQVAREPARNVKGAKR
jgi:hypothetical protein